MTDFLFEALRGRGVACKVSLDERILWHGHDETNLNVNCGRHEQQRAQSSNCQNEIRPQGGRRSYKA
jgi:hypothetical protein